MGNNLHISSEIDAGDFSYVFMVERTEGIELEFWSCIWF
jgi:hypothetical protein